MLPMVGRARPCEGEPRSTPTGILAMGPSQWKGQIDCCHWATSQGAALGVEARCAVPLGGNAATAADASPVDGIVVVAALE